MVDKLTSERVACEVDMVAWEQISSLLQVPCLTRPLTLLLCLFRKQLVHSSTCLLVHLLCYLVFDTSNLSTRQLVRSSTCSLVYLSTCPLTMLLCLWYKQLVYSFTRLLVYSFTCPLVHYQRQSNRGICFRKRVNGLFQPLHSFSCVTIQQ